MSDQPRAERPSSADLRASDEDRERLISELNEHAVAGRISTEELEERLQGAYAAKTVSALDDLRHDLPVTPRTAAASLAARRSQLTRRLIQETGGSAALFLVCTVIWLVSDAHRGQFWPVWVLIVLGLSLVRNGWGLWGPAPDLDSVERHLDRRHGRRAGREERRSRRLGP
jgi:Domain of unknown function (DUF1707)